MQNEVIIRQEAKEFYSRKMERSNRGNAIDDIHEVKQRLEDFYSPESKAIFLDEIERQVTKALQDHRDKAHGGQPGVDCSYEKKPVALSFYLHQELGTLPIVAHQRNKTDSTQIRQEVFVSYSHLDKEYLLDIQRHFKPFLKKLDIWDDTKIQPGQKWKE
jgi:hypothetical protein